MFFNLESMFAKLLVSQRNKMRNIIQVCLFCEIKKHKMRKKFSISLGIFISIILGIITFTGCRQHPPVFRIATNQWPGYEMLYLARNLGYYNELPIRLVEVSSNNIVTRGLRNGTLEAGCLTLDEAITLLQDSVDIRVILVVDESCGGDVLMAKPEIKNLSDLRGKRIGLENSTVSAILLDAALDEAGIKTDEITQIPMAIDEHLNGYLENKFDAVATFEPVRSQLLNKGANILYSSAKIPGRIVDVLVVRGDVMDAYSEDITTLLNGYFRALNYFEKKPLDASKEMAKRLGPNPLVQFNGLHILNIKENKSYLIGDSARLYNSTHVLMNHMIKHKLLRNSFSYKTFAEPKFLPTQ